MRKILCSINEYDLCITEFIRVVDSIVPKHVYYRLCPELHKNGYTSNQTPLRIQLLGQNPNWMAENAVRAVELGSHGIDVNFGCPAKAVNKSKGGAVLLKEPEQIYKIMHAITHAVDRNIAVSAKIRLGFDNTLLFSEIISAIESAGVNELAIHARTKLNGYNPPAYWEYINTAVRSTSMTIIANGEIWNKKEAFNCIKAAGTNNLMLGRGALSLPNIAHTIKYNTEPMSWKALTQLLLLYSELEINGDKSFYFSSRLKQWLKYLKLQYPEAEQLFSHVKRLNNKNEILELIKHSDNPLISYDL